MAKNSNKKEKLFQRKSRLKIMGLNINTDGVVKGFFGGNAYLAILFLLFICLFLFKSGMGFIPAYQKELDNARKAGLEVSNMVDYELKGFEAISSKLTQAFTAEKRTRFGDKEILKFVYEEFEGYLDDNLEDDIDDYLDIDENTPEKETSKKALYSKIESGCKSLDQEFLLKKIQPRIPSTTSIPEKTIAKAILYAKQYAIDGSETPEEIDAIPAEIARQMGDFGEINKALKTSSSSLEELHLNIEIIARESYEILKVNQQKRESIANLSRGLKKKISTLESADTEDRKSIESIIAGIELKIKDNEAKIVDIDLNEKIKGIYKALTPHDEIIQQLQEEVPANIAKLKNLDIKSDVAQTYIEHLQELIPEYLDILEEQRASVREWKHDEEVTFFSATKAFFFGLDWKTGSNRQSLYGIIPLFSGSLLISLVAMCFAVPLSIGAAIYVNQFASKREAGILKPSIEFIQAIPSVVLGLFGILVVGGLLKTLSAEPILSWIPGFPINDRLNVLLAGILLAFMASPTIFTLAEDAINNVPKSYKEASLAMGATRLQTSIRVILPAALSGIIAAIMLGFGRVIGETMVVLLVAGNKAKIPEFSEGIGVLGQPVHTMTGIIAQEYGEAAQGSTIYQSLFMVGLVLFTISLVINSICQRILTRQRK